MIPKVSFFFRSVGLNQRISGNAGLMEKTAGFGILKG
jgi:hypothetical protein